MARRLPGVRRRGAWEPVHGRGRPRVRRLLPRRHRRDERPRATGDAARDRRAVSTWHHDDAAHRRRTLGRGRAEPAVRRRPLAVRADGDGCQPVLDPPCAPRDRPAEGARLRGLLPRHGRRDLRDALRGSRRRAAGKPRAAGPARRDDEGGRVERRRRVGGFAPASRRRARPHGTGADERRHRPSGARLPRRAPRADAQDGERGSRSTRRTRSAAAPAAIRKRTGSSPTS